MSDFNPNQNNRINRINGNTDINEMYKQVTNMIKENKIEKKKLQDEKRNLNNEKKNIDEEKKKVNDVFNMLIGNNKLTITTLTGYNGSTGPTGQIGFTGPTGSTGTTGPSGPLGPSGPRGLQGLQGQRGGNGSIGPTGLMGPTGTLLPSGSYYSDYLFWNENTWINGGATGFNSIHIGRNAGLTNQGQYSIAIGPYAGAENQAATSIALNATDVALNPTETGFYVAPIRATGNTSSVLVYNTTTREIAYSTSKTFVIDHPTNKDKYLVHGCLEGPEGGVYYRGESEIVNNYSVEIELPDYVDKIARDFTISLTPIFNGDFNIILLASKIENNRFKVYSKSNTKFYWQVFGKRVDIEVEPDKNIVNVKGNGPYKWI